MLSKKSALWGVVVALSLGTAAQAAVTFVADYSGDGANEGFNDPTYGVQRKAAFQFALNIWGTKLQNSYAGETVRVLATFDPLGGSASSATLGQAGPVGSIANFSPPANPKYQTSTWFAAALANHIKQSDMYTAGMGNEISATFNSDVDNSTVLGTSDFYYGTDGNAGSDSDFISVVLHEIAHGLGFTGTIKSDGSYNSSLPSIYDRFLENGGNALTGMSNAQRVAAIKSNALYWTGADGTAANGNTQIQMYAPTTYSAGSSIYHVDQSLTDLMAPIYQGVNHSPSARDLGILSDIGWDLAPVPEPASLAVIGLLAAGQMLRRRGRRGV
ncbi:MAG: PEP-CTERM sorting domain-containing protein [Phycisphaerales bacterium]|jgi:hypothetical protein|nr:PEP-CTERM sorting domain-containing protein [Phycisphaerales bacterium]